MVCACRAEPGRGCLGWHIGRSARIGELVGGGGQRRRTEERTIRYFYDSEFIEDGTTIDLVSIAVVCEDGREYYAVSTEFDAEKAGPFVRRNVLPKLPPPSSPLWRSRERIRDDLYKFLVPRPGVEPELWAWVGAYDHVALCQLWGSMVDLPNALPRYTNELRQHWDQHGRPALPPVPKDAHDALADARHNLAKFEAIEAHRRMKAF